LSKQTVNTGGPREYWENGLEGAVRPRLWGGDETSEVCRSKKMETDDFRLGFRERSIQFRNGQETRPEGVKEKAPRRVSQVIKKRQRFPGREDTDHSHRNRRKTEIFPPAVKNGLRWGESDPDVSRRSGVRQIKTCKKVSKTDPRETRSLSQESEKGLEKCVRDRSGRGAGPRWNTMQVTPKKNSGLFRKGKKAMLCL